MTDPNLNGPPAIVRPVDVADQLTALILEVIQHGRRTIAAKIATGKALIALCEEIDRRNEEIQQRKDRFTYAKAFKRAMLSQRTAYRLMTAARSYHSPTTLAEELDAIYDDGIDPTLEEGKIPCRDCRVRGKPFSSKCPSCRALNRKPSLPKDDGPPRDLDGNLLPEHLIPIFAEGQLIHEWGTDLGNKVKALSGLVERPGCSALQLEEMRRRVARLRSYAEKYKPGYLHITCQGQGCSECDRRGWFTVMKVADERAAIANAKKREQAKDWYERQRANTSIPE